MSGEQKTAEEEKAFGELKWKVGRILAEKFLEYNDGKFHATLELNPATHALTEFIFEHSAALKEALSELIRITSRMENIISVDEHYKSALERAKKLLNKQPQSESDKTE